MPEPGAGRAGRPQANFADPSGGADAAAQNFDNQGPQLILSGGKLYAAWERRKTKSTQTQVWVARIDESGALALPHFRCSRCGSPLSEEEIPEKYFGFLQRY